MGHPLPPAIPTRRTIQGHGESMKSPRNSTGKAAVRLNEGASPIGGNQRAESGK